MTVRRWVSWLCLVALMVCASWACWRIGRAFQAVEQAANATAAAMRETAEYKQATWQPGPPPR